MKFSRWSVAGVLGWLLVVGIVEPAVAEAERTLIVVLDAVPYGTMERLTDPAGLGLFDELERPVPLISTFPSSTSIALAGILGDLGLDRSPGYEPRFFDWETRRRRGGGPVSYFQVAFPWRRFFDWNRKGALRNALHATQPIRAGIREMRAALAAFEAEPADTFSIYIADTDTAAHLHGPDGFDSMLVALDAELEALLERGPALRVILLSDHGLAGGEPLVNVLPAVRAAVVRRGWKLSRRLQAPTDVVLTPYGLVSSFEAYAEDALVGSLAQALAGAAGVELCVFENAEGWRALSGDDSIDFERRQGSSGLEWRWRTQGAGNSGLAAQLATVATGNTWLADEELLARTAAGDYPDALYRIATGFGAVANPASVVCSVAAGHMFGAKATERVARWTKGRLRWTHGALGRAASLGFMASNAWRGHPPAALRYDQALEAILGESASTR